ncbi:DUF3857 domain-containing transglutaminase family protein [Cesiribacter sp. SM1]|uniref:DUF3857 domain-containing transglutaminase family protein n=1 Tax=Cesiribacter sp. SM1 TaxID=2861196 RepID=UPI001CD31863|nr:DUF3857 domain-containing transglutaminase family protein [Cesiribacter sp. SM1]
MRIKLYTLLITMSLLPLQQALAFAGPGNKYPAAQIPEELKKGANAVIREEVTTFRILSTGKAEETLKKVVTVLNPQGDDEALMFAPYDKLNKHKKLEGVLYDASGKQVRKLKSSDVSDQSYLDGGLINDNRYKTARLKHTSYPYTVEWYREGETTNMMFYPQWQPPVDEKVGVEQAQLEIICPPGFTLRHRTHKLQEPQIFDEAGGSKRYQWKVEKLAPVAPEPYASYWQSAAYVLTAPVDFEVEGYKGNMESWQQLGVFMNQLLKGRDVLTPEAENTIKQLTGGLATPEEKVKAVYEYMQQNTRYVSIQLGIGGWQPFEASFVHQKGYGDCKALSNYTKALLKSIDIPSYYTIIHAGADGTNSVLEDFPKRYFNHVILCVPLEKDTVWLECTSQTKPFNHMGSFTGNRKALLVTEQGGKLVNTPVYSAADNYRYTKTIVDLEDDQPQYKLSRRFGGIQFDLPYEVMRADPQIQKKWLYEHSDLPNVSINQHKLKRADGAEPVMLLEAGGVLQEKQMRSGTRMFLPLSLNRFPVNTPRPMANRKTDFEQEWGYTYSDTLVYKVPAAYTLEHLPEPQHIKTEFGEYELKAEYKKGELISIATFRIDDGRYAAARYADWVAFVQQVKSAHATKAVLVQAPQAASE